MSLWTPRLGFKAAQDLFEIWLLLLVVPLLAVVWIPLDISGAVTHSPAVWGAGVGVMVVEAVLVLRMWVKFQGFRAATDAQFGHHVRLRDMPPLDADRFHQWCLKRGIAAEENSGSTA